MTLNHTEIKYFSMKEYVNIFFIQYFFNTFPSNARNSYIRILIKVVLKRKRFRQRHIYKVPITLGSSGAGHLVGKSCLVGAPVAVTDQSRYWGASCH